MKPVLLGMEAFFTSFGIYSSKGQLYEPVDREQMMYYKEAIDGQILEEGINEAGAMSSFVAAGTAYSNLGINMIPFYVYYSMFGFQRVGDLIWLAADSRAKGFLVGGTSGRTTLNGEGLQHQDGHSQLMATTVPSLVAYDPAYAYELAIIVQDGLRRMYAENECVLYYISVYNEQYEMPEMPKGVEEGVLKGIYKVSSSKAGRKKKFRPQLLGSGTILRKSFVHKVFSKKSTALQQTFGVSPVTANSLGMLKSLPDGIISILDETPKTSYLEETFADAAGPFISSSENVRLVADQVREWIPGPYAVLGTDGFGRSETREALRRHFEIDAECTVYATLIELAKLKQFDADQLPQAMKDLGIDPDKIDPRTA